MALRIRIVGTDGNVRTETLEAGAALELAPGETVVIDKAMVDKHVGDLAKSADLSRYVL